MKWYWWNGIGGMVLVVIQKYSMVNGNTIHNAARKGVYCVSINLKPHYSTTTTEDLGGIVRFSRC